MKKYIKNIIACFLISTLIFGGCNASTSQIPTSGQVTDIETASNNETSQSFSDFTTELFTDMISSDALTLHYQLKNPAAYNISLDEINLGRIDIEHANTVDPETSASAYLKRLAAFNYDALSEDEQLTYDILKQFFEDEVDAEQQNFFFYQEYLGNNGAHSLLPILMSEYTFYDKEDVDTYLTLLGDIPAYFENIIAFEKAKAEAGLFMSDESVDEVIDSCEQFIENPDENMLITLFPDKIDSLALSEDEVDNYTARNNELIKETVIPAYQALIENLTSLKGSGTNENGLYYFENGKAYYEYLAKSKTGSSKTPQDMIAWIEQTLNTDMVKLAMLLSKDEHLMSQLSHFDLDVNEPIEMLDTLQEALKTDFPEAVTSSYTLKYVPKSLESSMNPAFYMIPPIDDPYNNVIYLNQSQLNDNLSVFTTLAHEGYPGHLYQNTAFAATHPAPIRQELDFLGYVEGWATYVELMSFNWCHLNRNLSTALMLNQEMSLCLYGRIDLGIHYEGWTLDNVKTFLKEYGIENSEAAHDVFRAVISEPASYLPYCIGNLEFSELRDKYSEELEKKFKLQDFHTQIVKLGPAQFDIIDKYLQKRLPSA